MNAQVENVESSTLDAASLIALLQQRQVDVRAELGELVVKAPRGAMTPDMLAALKQHKADVLAWAQSQPARRDSGQRITPEMLPLARLEQAQIDRIVEATPGGAAAIQDIYALAPLQEGILFHHLLQPEGDAYLNQLLLRFDSRELLDRFVAALDRVIARQDVLRTAVHWDALEQPVQVVWQQARLPLEFLTAADGDVREQLAAKADPRRCRLDVRRAPLMQGYAAQDKAEDGWLLQLLYHHLVMDHISLEVLVGEVALILLGREEELPPPVPFRNFVAAARLGRSDSEHLAFFRRQLADVEEPTAPFDLLDVQGNGANTLQAPLPLPRELALRLRGLAREHGVSAASLFHLAWAQVLARCSGRDDVVFGTVLFGRLQGGAGADRALGMFINTLPLRVQLQGQGAAACLKQVHAGLVDLLRHEHASLTLAQRASGLPANTPLFSALINFRYSRPADATAEQAVPGIRHVENRDRTNYPFVLHVDDLGEDFRITAEIVDRIDAARISAFVLQTLHSLADALERAPQTPMAAIEVLPAAERETVVDALNATAQPFDGPQLVHRLVEQQVQRTPAAIALVHGDEQLDYAGLDRRATQLAHVLRRAGVVPDSRVAVALERGIDLVVALLAVLKAGGAYVPLDTAHPHQRLAQMLADATPVALLCRDELAASIVLPAGCQRLAPDAAADEIEIDGVAADAVQPHHLAYVIYTSGSTGLPKGVAMPHAPLCNLLHWQRQVLPGPARTLQFAALGFDVAFQEIFSTLATGGTLVLIDESLRQDLPQLAQWLAQQPLQRLFLPYIALNGLAEVWAQLDLAPRELSDVITAGEQLRITPAIRRLFASNGARLHNHYGPTESHVVSAHVLDGDATNWPDLPPIGRPIANCRLYLLDAEGRPVPRGASGEIHIAGAQVARSYLQRPALTAERFGDDAFVPGGRRYRTGDLARWRDDGALEYLGRNDFQVKIRGYRIELGEIETQLVRIDGVREAAVIAREDVPGERRLVAYVVADAGATLDGAGLRAELARRLPEYMLPVAFVPLAQLPQTTNGKLDRKNLPPPDGLAFSHRAYTATVSAIEDTLAQIWCELLGVDRVGRFDNFFELGGHSLLAVRLVSQLRERLGVELPLPALFTHPQLADLALDIAEAGQNTLSAIQRADRNAPLPLSFAQQRLWFLARVDPEASRAYHLPDAVRLRGALDVAALQRTFDRIVERHEVLRTRFVALAGEVRQVIDAPRPFDLVREDVAGIDAQTLEQLCLDEANRPFDLALGPLIRGRLLRLAADDHVLLVTMHHIVSDGWSGGVLANEFSALYDAFRQGQADPLPPLAIQYADFGVWQRQWLQGPLLQQQLQQLVQQLRGAPALLDLPTDRPRPAIQDYAGANLPVVLDEALTRGVKALAQRHGTTVYMTLLAAWAAVLSRFSGQDQVVIGSSHAGRSRVEVEPLIGFFINTQALKVDLSGAPDAKTLLAQVRQTAVQAQSLQDVPFERLVEALNPPRSLAHHPVFQVMLSWHNTPRSGLALAGLAAEPVGGAPDSAQFEISLELREDGERISGQFNYATALFDASTLQRQWDCLVALLRGMVADDGRALDSLDLLGEEARAQVIETFNAAAVETAPATLMHRRFEQQVALQPETLAIEFDGDALSYAELNQRANQLARELRARGAGPDQRVALCFNRSLELVVALLATLKAGAAFVPLDPVHPDERLAHMWKDSNACLLLAAPVLRPRIADAPDDTVLALDLRRGNDSAWSHHDGSDLTDAEVGLGPQHLAYVIYTSGSTGTPKGVALEQRNLGYFLHALETCIHGESPDCRRVAWNSSFGFDMAVKAWGQLAFGRSVFLVPEATRLDADAMLDFLERHAIDTFEGTPSHLRLLLGAGLGRNRAPALRKVLLGGEAIDATLWRRLAASDTTRFYNMYGPTECSVDASCGRIDGRRPHIGRPMPGARIYLLDREGQPVPVGVAGEIHIGGAGVARGYLDRPELTAQRFVPDPFGGGDGRLYRSGDLGRWREDGCIEYLGRNDAQVKVRGFRIELGEIQARLAQLPGVTEAAVIAREDVPGDTRLVAYVVAASAAPPDAAALRAALAQQLPDYMLPAAFVVLAALPLTANGKLDQRALPAPEGQGLAQQRYEAPQGDVEQAIAAIWAELLGVEQVGRHDNFFELGGYSLMVFQVIERLKDEGYGADLQDVLLAQELSALAQRIAPRRDSAAHPQWVAIRRGGSRRPLVFIHEPSGEVLSYERLARQLPEAIAIYGIRADVATVTADTRFEDLAAGYVQILRQALPQGPYRLAGWSAGGTLALEVARQLQAQGETVEFLGLIDAWNRDEADRGVSELGLDDRKQLLIAMIDYFGRKLDATEAATLLQAGDIATALALARREGWLVKDMSAEEFEQRAALWFHLRAAAHRYVAAPLTLPTHLFRADAAAGSDTRNGWGAVLGDSLAVQPIGGDHWSIVMEPRHAAVLGLAIARRLDQLDGVALGAASALA